MERIYKIFDNLKIKLHLILFLFSIKVIIWYIYRHKIRQ